MDQYLASLASFPKINTDFWQKTISNFKSYEEIWHADYQSLSKATLNQELINDFLSYRNSVKPQKILENYKKNLINIVSLTEPEYPKKLKEIYNPPFVLFYKGDLNKIKKLTIAVVGARKCTDYGRRVTVDITSGLAKAGVLVVSGLALGLDTEAHKATIKEGGVTFAVLANGLDSIYPSSNSTLAKEILKNGAIISEQPIGMPALKQNFPARNRIISGLSDGVLVTEAGDHSGTLHTANFALEQNRNVYAVPGPIYNEMAKGPNNLIKNGAKSVSSAADILEDFGIEESMQEIKPENDNERLIFSILELEPKHIDTISKESKKPSAEISQIITLMEIKGKIRHLGGMVYSLKK